MGSASAYVPAYAATAYQSPEARAKRALSAYDTYRDQYEQEVARAQSARDEAQRNAASTKTGAEAVLGDYNKGPDKASKLATWTPDATMAFEPTQMGQWMSALRTEAPTLSAGGSPRVSAPSLDFRSTELEKFDPKMLEDFDPSTYGAAYARGAYGDFSRGLGRDLEALKNESVARGRFDTGLYDEDNGKLITGLGEAFEDKLAQQSGVFSGQRLSALQGAADLRYRRASDIDTNARTIAGQRAELAARADEFNASHALDADRLALEGYTAETSRLGLGLDAARASDQLRYSRASDLDRLTYDQARQLSDVAEGRARTGLDAALGRERTYLDESRARSDAASSAVSGARDWAAQDREMEDLRAEIARLRQMFGAQGTTSASLDSSNVPGFGGFKNVVTGANGAAAYW